MKSVVALLLFLSLADSAGAHRDHDATPAEPQILAPGYGALAFPAPAPGTYELPPLGVAGDGMLLDAEGRPARLHDLLGDRITLLSFVYTACNDVNGCPLAGYVLSRVQDRLAADPHLNGQVRLLSVSFDPGHDTPAVMASYGANFRNPACDWRFLTAASEGALAPTLAAYDQSVVRDYDADGNYLGTISHILRVYLIDRARRIRNIYSVSFLHPDTILADIETLLLAEGRPGTGADASPRRHGAGDDRRGYEHTDFQTRSKDPSVRLGRRADLRRLLDDPPLGLPEVPIPADNPATAAKIALGRKLFYDRRLSHNGTLSCAMCHVPEQGFTSQELATAVGIEGRSVRRNAPTLYNVAYAERLFHDAREDRLEQQIWNPLLAFNEMGNPAIGVVLDRIRAAPDYEGLFESAFPERGLTMETLGMALASYERTLISANSPFDRWHFGKEPLAMGAAAVRGFRLFTGKAGCVSCHTIAQDHALFTDRRLHNTGIGYVRSMGVDAPPRRVQVAPGTFIDIDPATSAALTGAQTNDLGRYEVTGDPADRWKYRTPTLRNVALTAPYMHDGSLRTLDEVVDFYNRGGVSNPLLDPLIRPLGLSETERADLIAFLRALTGDNVDMLVEDAFAAPIGDPQARR
jgi:cytochrome c peroxidase